MNGTNILEKDKFVKRAFDGILIASGIKEEGLKSKKRDRDLVSWRQIFYHYVITEGLCSLGIAGSVFGQDHATVLHGIGTINRMIETNDKYYCPRIEKFKRKLILIDNGLEDFIRNIRFDANNMSEQAFIEKYKNIL